MGNVPAAGAEGARRATGATAARAATERPSPVSIRSLLAVHAGSFSPAQGATRPHTLASVYYPSGGTVTYACGASGLNRVTAVNGDVAGYSYRGVGTITGLTLNDFDAENDAVAMTLSFDKLNRVEEIKWTDVSNQESPVVLDHYDYAYDRNSNRVYRQNAATTSKDECYTYDGLDRLATANRGALAGSPLTITDANAIFSQQWQNSTDAKLDSLGNWVKFRWDPDGGNNSWTSQDRTHNKVNELTGLSGDWIDPLYDPAGNMVSGPKPGAETTGLQFVPDPWNRLVAVKNSGGTVLATYRYNGLNHRVRKLLGGDPANPTSSQDYYYNTSWQLLETYGQASATHPLDRYVWGLEYIDAPIIRYRDGNTDGDVLDEGDSSLYYLHDANFNATGLVDKGQTAVAERYMYEPYGRATVLNGADDADEGVNDWSVDSDPDASDWSNEVLYAGYRRDSESALYHVRNRYYHPTLGRWVSRDPLTGC